jgi:hypothetical protein
MGNENESRREALKKIGVALAATAVGAVALPAEAQPVPKKFKEIKLPATVTTAVKQGGDFDVFVAHSGSDASVLVVASSDTQGSAELAKTLRASPAKATVVNGVIHVGLGTAGASRSSVRRQGVIDFRQAVKTNAVLIVR